jgi:hypothetical protein
MSSSNQDQTREDLPRQQNHKNLEIVPQINRSLVETMENPNTNNPHDAASRVVNEPNSDIRDEIGTVEDPASVPEQIASDDAEPVPFVHHVEAAINDEKLVAKETSVSSDEVLDADADLQVTSDGVFDADDEPLRSTDQRESRESTEPTTAVAARSSDNATANDHLIEAYLVEDEQLPVYDATPELPWWKQKRFQTFIFLIGILLLLVAALLAVFLVGDPSSSTSLEATTTLAPSSAPSTSLFPSFYPHTSPKVSLVV